MSKLVRSNSYDDPFRLLSQLEEAFSTNKHTFFRGSMSPASDVVEEVDSTTIYMDLPGMIIEDIDISSESGTLIVMGERKPLKVSSGNYSRSERIFGKFVRTWTVPTNLDTEKIEASYEKGILAIKLPRKEESKPKPVKIKIIGE